MQTTESIWMTPQARHSLEQELAALMAVPNPAGADESDRADQVVDAWLARKERIRQIHELLSRADHAVNPADDGVAEPGMVLTVRFDDTGDTETFLLGTRGTADAEIDVYTVNSPLGSALLGATPGQQRTYQLPNGGTQQVTVLAARPFGAHQAEQLATQ
ncbi:GreA/GreB family elongation factor [Mycolicibacterium vaccae]|uniref:GreA/GreB family elongation factor n=1 Tax=Mycolicibacterium vaccae ATCC 25954 TaxID=1194972 RepID=K0VB43_MYCVA|nr:GreA/GreB family elongation factor [Mycolicibacterium vaccae]ANI41685.1 gramicidin S synthase [Mycolicibacterium vaccae 95051]EJZ11988.1 GreA/GreB family elongation factor [Mycolicibacterium vaccae ATCC 25954]MCV7062167.1 GreA/GreB family elongation factor [Mycolicibacterium vaccae]